MYKDMEREKNRHAEKDYDKHNSRDNSDFLLMCNLWHIWQIFLSLCIIKIELETKNAL